MVYIIHTPVIFLCIGSSQKEIRDRFKKLALKWHPDKNFHSPDESQKVRNVSIFLYAGYFKHAVRRPAALPPEPSIHAHNNWKENWARSRGRRV